MKKIFLLLVTVSISLHGTIKPVAQNYLQSGLLNEIENGSATQVSVYLLKGASPNDRINETQETPPMFAIHQLAKEAKNNYRIETRLKDIGISSLFFTGGLAGMLIGLLLIQKSNLADRGMSSSEIVLAHSGLGVVLLSGIASTVAGAPFFDRATYSQTLMLYKRFKIIKKLLNHAEIDIHLTNENGKAALDIVRSYIVDSPDCDQLVKVMKKVESLLLEKDNDYYMELVIRKTSALRDTEIQQMNIWKAFLESKTATEVSVLYTAWAKQEIVRLDSLNLSSLTQAQIIEEQVPIPGMDALLSNQAFELQRDIDELMMRIDRSKEPSEHIRSLVSDLGVGEKATLVFKINETLPHKGIIKSIIEPVAIKIHELKMLLTKDLLLAAQ